MGKLDVAIKYLEKIKHKKGKYLIEFNNANVRDDEWIAVDLNVIPTEDNTSYIYDIFYDCAVPDIADEIKTLISFHEDIDIEIFQTLFNGEEVSISDYSISDKFVKQLMKGVKHYSGKLTRHININYQKAEVTFICDYELSKVEPPEDETGLTFYYDGKVTDFLINGVSQEVTDEGFAEFICSSLPYIFDNERISSTDVAWSLLNDDMDANYCDYYVYGIFYYTEFLGMKVEPQNHDVGIGLFTSKIDDFVNGYY
jgi:hypothetical protein